ncbi:MAG: zinc ribbon domain-containing protein [Bacteroidaceae bacterium]|nr:zinc ribbon domain-containing protein [Bacteroidaceae bacterium]
MALIICPECGREISSRARSCPHCGAENKELQQPATVSHQEHKTTAHKKERKISNKKIRLILLCSLVGIILIGGIGWLLYHNYQQAKEEEMEYDMLMEDFSIADAETFLLKHPETEHKKDIQDNIALYQRYEQEWAKIVTSTNVDDFAMFRSKFPNSPFDQRAYDKIDSLDWTYAKRSDTEGALQKYLDLHPDGKFAEMAREQKQFIIDSRPTDEERSTIGSIINAYFAALTDNNKEALSNITTSTVFSKSCDFIDGHAGNSVTSYSITSPVSIEKRPSDDGPTYNATCTVSRTATDSDGAPLSKTFSVRASFNTQLQLSAMSMKGQDE